MKAAVLTGVRAVEVRDVPRPSIKAEDDVLLRTAVAGLCGSDLHYFVSDNVGGERVKYPAIVGHECTAVVEAVGRRVERVRPGDRVAVEPAISCGTCDQCRAGRMNTCRTIGFLGHPGEKDGCLAESFIMPERNCYRLPQGLTMTEGMLAEPLSIALHALQLAGESTGRHVAVLGAGPIGLCLILAARAAAVPEVWATDKVEARVAASRRAGAAWAGNPDREDIVKTILTERPLGLDSVFDCSGDPAAIDQAVELVKPGGRIFLIGIPMVERVALKLRTLRRKEIALQNVRRQNKCLEKALAHILEKRIDAAWLATHTFKLDEAALAFATAADRTDGVLKAAIRIGSDQA
jgi:L-iditol 2-dehydrogenase